ncbi:MAG: glycosyltransferase family 4 protein [Candidatus Omnitrophica bacterium]|nr:glycosyltransferase family 4 protein [Candidatus Omnitrophota bacterium]
MKSIFIPDYSDGNPYQELLARALKKYGVTVTYSNPTGIFCLLKIVKKARQSPDTIIHLHWINTLIPLGRSNLRTAARILFFDIGLLLLRMHRIKLVWTIHNKFCHDSQHRKIERMARRALAQTAQTLFVHSPSVIPELAELYNVTPDKFQVIDHGHYIDVCPNNITEQEARAKNNIPQDHLVYLSIGSLKKYKGVMDIIEAYQQLHIPNSTLLIVGQPSDQTLANELQKRCRDDLNLKLIFKFVNDQEMQFYLNCADVVVYSFKEILTSGSLILALSFKKAVIAPALGCIPDIVNPSGSFLYDPNDPQGLLQAMSSASKADLKKMGEHNFKTARSFDWDRIATTTFDVYSKTGQQ